MKRQELLKLELRDKIIKYKGLELYNKSIELWLINNDWKNKSLFYKLKYSSEKILKEQAKIYNSLIDKELKEYMEEN